MAHCRRPLILASLVAVAAFALLASGCGGGDSAGVASVAAATPATTTAATTTQTGTPASALAFARCMRSHGIRGWPDPNGSGAFDKSKLTLQQLGVSSSQLQAAQTACQRLLRNGGQPLNQAGLRKMEHDALNFARCMRSHGVTNWPDPTLRDGTPLFDLHRTTIAPNSPPIVAKEQRCTSLLHLPGSPPTSGGAHGSGD